MARSTRLKQGWRPRAYRNDAACRLCKRYSRMRERKKAMKKILIALSPIFVAIMKDGKIYEDTFK